MKFGVFIFIAGFWLLMKSTFLWSKDKPSFLMIVSEGHPTSLFNENEGLHSEINPTPYLKKIAEKCFMFTNVFCSSASPGSSFASFLTSKHAHMNGFSKDENKFDYSNECLPKLLQENGYETVMIGKWEFNNTPMYFNDWNTLVTSSEKYNPEFSSPRGNRRIEGYSTDIIADLAIQWMSEYNEKKPFFMLIQFNATSDPLMPAIRHLNLYDDKLLSEPENLFDIHREKASPARYQSMSIEKDLHLTDDLFFQIETNGEQNSTSLIPSKSKKNLDQMTAEQFSAWSLSWRPTNEAFARETHDKETKIKWKFQRFAKNYLRCIHGIDENIERIDSEFSKLTKNDIIFIYTAKHGRFLGQHGWFGNNWMYEESLRTPLFIRTNSLKSTHKTISAMSQNIDLAPTILDFANAKKLTQSHGKSLIRWLTKDDNIESWRDCIYFHHNQFPSQQMVAKHYGIRNKKYKLIHYYQFDEWELYDLEKDPSENYNLYKDQAYKTQTENLKKALNLIRKKYSDFTDISIMPEDWRKFYRGPEARKKERNIEFSPSIFDEIK